jgi:hypothetical protein
MVVTARYENGRLAWTGYFPSEQMKERSVTAVGQKQTVGVRGDVLLLTWSEDGK